MELPTWVGFSWRAALLAGVLVPVSNTFAVEARVYQLENGGAIAPHLTVELGQDSNPLRGENGSEGSAFLQIEPDLKYILQRRNNTLTLGYQGAYLQYFNQYCSEPTATTGNVGFDNIVERPGDCASSASQTSNKASYQNHSLGLAGFVEISRRARANLNLSTNVVHQPLGTGLSASDSVLSVLSEPDSFVRNSMNAAFSYGAYQARGEVRLGLNYRDRKFRDNGGRNLDNLNESSFGPSASLFYRVGSRTQVFAGFGVSDISGGNSERSILRRFIGVEFDASAITSGSIRVSDVTEDFDDTEFTVRDDLNYTGFDIDLTWRPRRFSTVTIGAGRETERATLSEGLGITTEADIEWQHYWRDRISTQLEIGIQRNESTGRIVNNDANDRSTSVRLEGNYNIRRWVDVGAFVQADNRTGTNVGGETRDFSRTLVGLTANATF